MWCWLAVWRTPFWRHNLEHFGLITNTKHEKLKIMENVQNWLPPGFQIYDLIKNWRVSFFSGSGSRSKIRHIAQGWPLFNIFNQIVKVKVEIRECFLIQFFFSTARTLYFSVFLQLSLNCDVKMVSVTRLITIKMLKNQGKGHK